MSDEQLSDHFAITRTIQLIARAYDLKQHDVLLPLAFEPDAKQHYYFLGRFVDFSMPGGITDQSVGAKTAAEQWVADDEFIHRDERVWDALPGVMTPVS